MMMKKLRDELDVCHATMRALTRIIEEQKKDIAVLNESLDIVTAERDELKAIVEGRQE